MQNHLQLCFPFLLWNNNQHPCAVTEMWKACFWPLDRNDFGSRDCGPPDLESVQAEQSPEGQTHCNELHLTTHTLKALLVHHPPSEKSWGTLEHARTENSIFPKAVKAVAPLQGNTQCGGGSPTSTRARTHAPPLTYNKHTHVQNRTLKTGARLHFLTFSNIFSVNFFPPNGFFIFFTNVL